MQHCTSKSITRFIYYIMLELKRYFSLAFKGVGLSILAVGAVFQLLGQIIDDVFRNLELEEKRKRYYDYYDADSELGINKDIYEGE